MAATLPCLDGDRMLTSASSPSHRISSVRGRKIPLPSPLWCSFPSPGRFLDDIQSNPTTRCANVLASFSSAPALVSPSLSSSLAPVVVHYHHLHHDLITNLNPLHDLLLQHSLPTKSLDSSPHSFGTATLSASREDHNTNLHPHHLNQLPSLPTINTFVSQSEKL